MRRKGMIIMKRRAFLASLLATPALSGQAHAHERRTFAPKFSRFRFFHQGASQSPHWLVLGTGASPAGWDLRAEVEEQPVEKLNISALLGGLFRAPVRARLREARLLGPVYLNGRTLAVPYDVAPHRAAIAHKRTEWIFRFRPKHLRAIPPISKDMFAKPEVGHAYLTADGAELIVLIQPTRVRP